MFCNAVNDKLRRAVIGNGCLVIIYSFESSTLVGNDVFKTASSGRTRVGQAIVPVFLDSVLEYVIFRYKRIQVP